jgi:hypothetical protein
MNLLQLKQEPSESTSAGVATAPWERLAAEVRDFDPGVVVLVARKAPRIRDALQLDFGASPLIVSDLAIPFIAPFLDGARVAVVDDVVNVGSTIRHAISQLEERGVRECRAFALARSGYADLLDGLDIHYDTTTPLGEEGLRALAWQTPETLQQLARPYDLDFPVIECGFEAPLHDFTDLFAAMCKRFADGRVYDLTTRAGRHRGIRRFAVDSVQAQGMHRKVRFYVDGPHGVCRLVPIQVASSLSTDPPASDHTWPLRIWEAVTNGEAERLPAVALARLRLFVDSLAYGLGFLAECRDLIGIDPELPFDVADAELILGPRVRRAATRSPLDSPPASQAAVAVDSGGESQASPFLEHAEQHGIVECLRRGNVGEDPLTPFMEIFELVAARVGASHADDYSLDWPYNPAEVKVDPYLRLRIGPTFFDLVELILRACPRLGSHGAARRVVTRLLDRFVDSGGVVPTTAEYEGRVYRIYRKGEAGLRDPVSNRTLYAMEQYGDPLSLTRLTKLLTILNFSDFNEPMTEVRPDDRGNTLCYRGSVLDESTEVGRYLLRTGKLRPAKQ